MTAELERRIAKLERRVARQPSTSGRYPEVNPVLFAKAPSGGIPARDGAKLGKATCDIYGLTLNANLVDYDLELWVQADSTTRTETVYNMSGGVTGNAYILIQRISPTPDGPSIYVVILEEC